tara:strand:- start:4290 stop:4523 length:234 start_codon:yes stop_codon:yes gene_type:complete
VVPEVIRKFYSYTYPQKAHILLRGIKDSQNKKYTWEQRVHRENEALIPLERGHVELIKTHIPDTKVENMVLRYGENI